MNRLRILTLNIWNRQGPWDQRLARIREGIAQYKPDLVGLQEVLSHDGQSQADDIAAGFDYHVAFGLAHDLGGNVHFGNAALSRWPIEGEQVFPLPSGGHDESRSLLMIETETPKGQLPFFVTHLNWKFHQGVVREAQVQAVADHVMREAPIAGLPPILVGDFNAQPDATEIRFLKGLHSLGGKSVFFGDCFDQVGEGPGYTFDSRRNPYAAVTHEYPRRIDYVFVRGPDRRAMGKPLSCAVVLDEVIDGVAASDHYGVLSTISF